MMYRREKRPVIDMDEATLILARIFDDKFIESPVAESTFLGYMDGTICEIRFYSSFIEVEQPKREFSAIKFGNMVTNKLFDKRGLKCTTNERINYNDTMCVSIMYDKESVLFHFWYR
jgi:hypothetical protein